MMTQKSNKIRKICYCANKLEISICICILVRTVISGEAVLSRKISGEDYLINFYQTLIFVFIDTIRFVVMLESQSIKTTNRRCV